MVGCSEEHEGICGIPFLSLVSNGSYLDLARSVLRVLVDVGGEGSVFEQEEAGRGRANGFTHFPLGRIGCGGLHYSRPLPVDASFGCSHAKYLITCESTKYLEVPTCKYFI